MLTGAELGKAIKKAIDLKIASGAARSKKEIAAHFGIEPPSIHDWIKRGTIKKDNLEKAWAYFSDVVGPEHWGLKAFPVGNPPLLTETAKGLEEHEWPFKTISRDEYFELEDWQREGIEKKVAEFIRSTSGNFAPEAPSIPKSSNGK